MIYISKISLLQRSVITAGSKILSFLTGSNPYKIEIQNGAAVRNKWLGHPHDFNPGHEEKLISAIRSVVGISDTVVLIGAHKGASTVIAARKTGPEGKVHAYEAQDAIIPQLKETLELNLVEKNVTLHHAVVEVAKSVYGDFQKADHVPATDIPDCDVLVMDCEGAEKEILKEMDNNPAYIIVETHPQFNSSTEQIISILEKQDYSIREVTPHDDETVDENMDIIIAENS